MGRIGILLTAVLSLVLLASAYGGLVDPRTTTKAAILTLGLPYLAMLTAVVAVVWLVLRQWRYALVPIAAIAIAWSPISRAVPVNVLSKGRDESKKTLKVMSFNAKYFSYNEDADGDGIHDAVKFLLSQDADIVAIQEGNAGNLQGLHQADFQPPLHHQRIKGGAKSPATKRRDSHGLWIFQM